VAAGAEDVVDCRSEIIQPRARDDDRVPPAVSFLGYTQESSALVLAEFEVKPLPFDLNFLRFENAVHLKTSPEFTDVIGRIGSKFCAVPHRKLFGGSGF